MYSGWPNGEAPEPDVDGGAEVSIGRPLGSGGGLGGGGGGGGGGSFPTPP